MRSQHSGALLAWRVAAALNLNAEIVERYFSTSASPVTGAVSVVSCGVCEARAEAPVRDVVVET